MPKKFSKEPMISFQKRVYETVKKIPEGKFLTYKEVAKLSGSPLAFRAVGNILNKNKSLKIPCHRVIRSDGSIGGYKDGAKMKVTLLKKEGIILENGKITSRPPK